MSLATGELLVTSPESTPAVRPPLLSVEQLSAGYGKLQVLWDVSLELHVGRTTCLVGANGVGKTTLLAPWWA